MTHFPAAAAIALTLAACSPAAEAPPANTASEVRDTSNATTASAATPAPPANAAARAPAAVPVLTLEGLGPLVVGRPVPADSGFTERGAQISEECRTVTSSDFPGVYAIVSDGAVRRITVGERSAVKLVEGIGVGSTEKQVLGDFAGFRSAPHEYEEAPAKYLTAPNAQSGDVALRFEIGADGKVSAMHIGTMPVLGYVEGCA